MNKEKIWDAIEELDWSDEKIPEIMEGFFNNPMEAIENLTGKCSKEHLQSLCELLECDEDEDEE